MANGSLGDVMKFDLEEVRKFISKFAIILSNLIIIVCNWLLCNLVPKFPTNLQHGHSGKAMFKRCTVKCILTDEYYSFIIRPFDNKER